MQFDYTFEVLKEKKMSTKNSISSKIILQKLKKKFRHSQYRQKLREFITTWDALLFSIVDLFTLWLLSDVELLDARTGWLAQFYPLPWQPTPKLYTVAPEGM